MPEKRTAADYLKRSIGTAALGVIYGGTLLLARLFASLRRILRRPSPPPGTLLLSGTFHNPNWFFAHITPLTDAGFERVIIVADGHISHLEGVEVVVPPKWLTAILTRAGAKLVMLLVTALREKPSLVMGYHIFPAAISALLAARACGARAGFQVTSGPLELEGGGWHAENRLLVSLGWPSRTIERLAHALTRQFELVVVRGSQAKHYVTDRCGYDREPVVVTGSVPAARAVPGFEARDIDILFVGRLAEYKRPDRFVRAMRLVADQLPEVRAVVAGDGPDRKDIEERIGRLNLGRNIELLGLRNDVPKLMARSRILLQTSRWEGVSIAVLESFMHGMVPVVSRVGDLGDVVRSDETGYIVTPDSIEQYADCVIHLLRDPSCWSRLSRGNHETALGHFSTSAVRGKWNKVFDDLGVI